MKKHDAESTQLLKSKFRITLVSTQTMTTIIIIFSSMLLSIQTLAYAIPTIPASFPSAKPGSATAVGAAAAAAAASAGAKQDIAAAAAGAAAAATASGESVADIASAASSAIVSRGGNAAAAAAAAAASAAAAAGANPQGAAAAGAAAAAGKSSFIVEAAAGGGVAGAAAEAAALASQHKAGAGPSLASEFARTTSSAQKFAGQPAPSSHSLIPDNFANMGSNLTSSSNPSTYSSKILKSFNNEFGHLK
jgi:hypothetical protein